MARPLRKLALSSLEEIIQEAVALSSNHRALGNWTLAQVCMHLAQAVEYSITGYPRRAPWIFQVTLGGVITRRILKRKEYPCGLPLPKKFTPPKDANLEGEISHLKSAIQKFNKHTHRFAQHPLGPHLTKDEWIQMHCLHAAHHFGFLAPML